MAGLGIGDLAQSLQMRRLNAKLKGEMTRLGVEGTTGRVSDIGRAVAGDHRAVVALNRSLTTLAAYKTAGTEAALLGDAMQSSVAVLQASLAKQGGAALLATNGTTAMIGATSTDAREAFSSAIGVLNVQVAGRSAFSGIETGAPLPAAGDLMAALTAAIGTPLTASDAAAAVTAWFDDPAGYGAQYAGSATTLAPLRLNAEETAELAVTALDPALRGALKGLALAALASEGLFAGDRDKQAALMQIAGSSMISVGNGMAELAARIGSVQGRISEAETRNAAETATIRTALLGLSESDYYDNAAALKDVEGQANTLYAITARLSALSLTDYLR